jgi:Rad3-related DNA helicase
VLCDPRIQTKQYGKLFLKCLEPTRSTDSVSEVKKFLKSWELSATADVDQERYAG